MSTREELAEASDFLAESNSEKEIVLKTMKGKKVKIRRISVGILAEIMKVAKDSEIEQNIWLVFKGLVSPQLKFDEVQKLGLPVLSELSLAIQQFSGLDKESLERLSNLLKGPS